MTAPAGFTVTDTPQHVELLIDRWRLLPWPGPEGAHLTPGDALDLGHALIDAANDALAHRDADADRLDEARDALRSAR